jgi:hypothetical protein
VLHARPERACAHAHSRIERDEVVRARASSRSMRSALHALSDLEKSISGWV